MRLAIMGGTFNPIHVGHLIAAEEVRFTLKYDTIIFVPAFIPPHKVMEGDIEPDDRAAMVSRAIEDNEHFVMDTFELSEGGISYTIDTISHLYQAHDDITGKIGVIIGDDLIDGLTDWHRLERLVDRVDFIVVTRNDDIGSIREKMPFDALYCVMPKVELSSSLIRTRLQAGLDCRYLLPDAVREYIHEKGLYHADTNK